MRKATAFTTKPSQDHIGISSSAGEALKVAQYLSEILEVVPTEITGDGGSNTLALHQVPLQDSAEELGRALDSAYVSGSGNVSREVLHEISRAAQDIYYGLAPLARGPLHMPIVPHHLLEETERRARELAREKFGASFDVDMRYLVNQAELTATSGGGGGVSLSSSVAVVDRDEVFRMHKFASVPELVPGEGYVGLDKEEGFLAIQREGMGYLAIADRDFLTRCRLDPRGGPTAVCPYPRQNSVTSCCLFGLFKGFGGNAYTCCLYERKHGGSAYKQVGQDTYSM